MKAVNVHPARKIDLNNFQVATTKTARHINRSILLNLIRTHQPISRAELARHSRLQRSTVSSITEQLAEWRTRIMPADPRTQSRLRGASALVLQKHFSTSQIA